MRADELIARLGLSPHPEGGWYRRLYCSTTQVAAAGGTRPAVTTIAYLLRAGETSRWHRVRSDEIWHFYEGAALDLHCADPALTSVDAVRLGPVDGAEPVHAVPASHWQTARSRGAYSLVGCTVAPGFDFADFTLMADDQEMSTALRSRFPQFVALL